MPEEEGRKNKLETLENIGEICSFLESQFDIGESSIEDRAFSVAINKNELMDVLSSLKDMKFNHLSDVTCVDYSSEDKFELVYHLWSHPKKLRGTVKVKISRESPSVDSIVDLWKGAQIHERENHEMFGIDFQGNPNLTPLFLEDWEEIPPFRKDFDSREYVKEKYYGGKYEYGER